MKHIILSLAAAALLPLASCSLLQKSPAAISGSDAASTPATEKVNKPSKSTAANKPSGQAPAPTDTAAATAPTAAVNASKHNLAGEWLMVQVGPTTLDRDEDMPYIFFDPSGRFYAYDGCNTVNGDYRLSASDVFSFSQVMTTRRYCPDQDVQHTIITAIGSDCNTRATFSDIGSESFIDLLGPSGKTIVRLRRANIDFLNGHWQVVAINGASVDEDAPADVFFDIAERKIHGNTGCNYFNGEIYLDHRQPNAIDFSQMGVTRMACPHTAQETAMLVALEETASAISGGKDSAMLLSADGREVLILRRTSNGQ